MSAETLGEAAALMRERANDAILATGDEPWGFVGNGYDSDRDTLNYKVANAVAVDVCAAVTEEQAEHIASWDPTVALAVAAWLDVTARDVGTSSIAFHAALAFARAYLRESS